MRDYIDLNAGTIMDGSATVAEIGQAILARLLEVASGALSASGLFGHREFVPWPQHTIFVHGIDLEGHATTLNRNSETRCKLLNAAVPISYRIDFKPRLALQTVRAILLNSRIVVVRAGK